MKRGHPRAASLNVQVGGWSRNLLSACCASGLSIRMSRMTVLQQVDFAFQLDEKLFGGSLCLWHPGRTSSLRKRQGSSMDPRLLKPCRQS